MAGSSLSQKFWLAADLNLGHIIERHDYARSFLTMVLEAKFDGRAERVSVRLLGLNRLAKQKGDSTYCGGKAVSANADSFVGIWRAGLSEIVLRGPKVYEQRGNGDSQLMRLFCNAYRVNSALVLIFIFSSTRVR